ncbi:MAG: haloalkane dehalogenase [Dehalococcoidia bacterium]|nr:haloalkane dehalogenase [Dehalococcoidia bacterium]
MEFVKPSAEELSCLRADPLLLEQELDVRPEVAEDIEKVLGFRAGRAYWRSEHDYLYAIELADLGRGRPSMATVYGCWDRYEPRPPDHEIDADLLQFLKWLAGQTRSIAPADIEMVVAFAQRQTGGAQTTWHKGSVLHTPEERFANLPGFPYEAKYIEIEGLRMAYVEHGAGDPILMLHGEPTWGYIYRKMIPALSQAGRVVVPDLIGFGRSDKPVADNAYSYKSHVRWVRKFIQALDLKSITLVCQDWGGLIGLRIVSQLPERFKRIVPMNTGIPNGYGMGEAFMQWRRYSQRQTMLNVRIGSVFLSEAEQGAYQAPFPSAEYQAAALVFPRLVPIRPDHPGAYDNRVAIEKLRTLDIPVLPICGENDPITAGAVRALSQVFKNIAPVVTIKNAGHFIQEDAGEETARVIAEWMKTS